MRAVAIASLILVAAGCQSSGLELPFDSSQPLTLQTGLYRFVVETLDDSCASFWARPDGAVGTGVVTVADTRLALRVPIPVLSGLAQLELVSSSGYAFDFPDVVCQSADHSTGALTSADATRFEIVKSESIDFKQGGACNAGRAIVSSPCSNDQKVDYELVKPCAVPLHVVQDPGGMLDCS